MGFPFKHQFSHGFPLIFLSFPVVYPNFDEMVGDPQVMHEARVVDEAEGRAKEDRTAVIAVC